MRVGSALATAVLLALVAAAVDVPRVHGAPPAGYVDVDGSPDVLLNRAHQGARGSTFPIQTCAGVPDPPGAGEVVWHFVLPQSVFDAGPRPGNIFDDLTVTFASAGAVTLLAAGQFGPPSQAHAYVTTPSDDVLLIGEADIFRDLELRRANDRHFNLSHTCVGPSAPTTTDATTASTDPTTTPPPTTPVPTDGSASATTSLPSTTTTLAPTTSAGAGGGIVTTAARGLPVSGADDGMAIASLIVLATGIVLAVVARRSPTN